MRICFISDSHCQHPSLPQADLLVHCGDLTGSGSLNAFEQEIAWLKSIKGCFPQGIIFVPGNHDIGLDPKSVNDVRDRYAKKYPNAKSRVQKTEADHLKILESFNRAGIRLLIDQVLEIEGVKFWGSPMTPTFMDWAFMGSENELSEHWAKVPEDTEILITHGPAYGLRDLCRNGHVGSSSLRYRIDSGLPDLKVHAFGHIHEGAGSHQEGRYLCLNASVLDGFYQGFNSIHVIDTNTWMVCETFRETCF